MSREKENLEARVDPALQEVAAYREAAHRLAHDEGYDLRTRCLAFRRLWLRADEAALPDFCRGAIWAEAREFLLDEEPSPDVPDDAVELAAISLRARGYVCCPTCARTLHDRVDFERWRQLRQEHIAQVRAREWAVR